MLKSMTRDPVWSPRSLGNGINRMLQFARSLLPQLLCVLLLVGAWEVMAIYLDSPLVPLGGKVYQELLKILGNGLAFQELWVTFYRMTLGFLFATAVAFPIGVISAVSRNGEKFFEPGLVLGLTVPGMVWAMLCVIWFGISLATPVVSVALGVIPSIVLTVQHGVRALGSETVEMTRVFRLKRSVILRRIWIPLCYSFVLSGARVGFSIAWKVIVLVELFGMSSGVGYQINSQFSLQNVEGVIAWTLAFWFAMMLIEYGVFRALERHANHWKKVASYE
jgi:NitT/TauT family transport system permease protein